MPVFLTGGESGYHDTEAAISTAKADSHDTKAVVSTAGVIVVHDTRLLVNPATSFLHQLGNVYFPWPPSRPAVREVRRLQLRDRDSTGGLYVYRKGLSDRAAHHLVFPRVDTSTIVELRRFVAEAVKGVRNPFNWKDVFGTQHTVRLAAPRIRYRAIGPNRYRVEIDLEEILS